MLLAEELMLLFLDDRSGKLLVDSTRVEPLLAGAVLVELALTGFVDVAGEHEEVKKGRVVVRRVGPTGDPLLDEALGRISEQQGSKPGQVLGKLGKGLQPALLERLAATGAVRSQSAKVWGIFPTTRWPEADPRFEQESRGRLASSLLRGQQPDTRTAALISLLMTADVVQKVVPSELDGVAVDKRSLKRRAKEIADSNWATSAARKAVEEIQAALISAAMVPVIVATTTS